LSKTATIEAGPALVPPREARRQLLYELVSGVSGLALAVFMWGHMVLVGSILTGAGGFNWLANSLEDSYIAQPTVLAILALFLIHAVMASRKIPAQLRERRRMLALARELRRRPVLVPPPAQGDPRLQPHLESLLWIWQVRTGMIILVLGSFHILLLALDIFTPLFGERTGIEAASSFARVQGGLWLLYAILLLCVEFHASVGLYRLAVKWGVGARLARETVWRVEHVILWGFLGLGLLVLLVLAGWLEPPLAFLLEHGP
jgi:fumarate reductase subunit C